MSFEQGFPVAVERPHPEGGLEVLVQIFVLISFQVVRQQEGEFEPSCLPANHSVTTLA